MEGRKEEDGKEGGGKERNSAHTSAIIPAQPPPPPASPTKPSRCQNEWVGGWEEKECHHHHHEGRTKTKKERERRLGRFAKFCACSSSSPCREVDAAAEGRKGLLVGPQQVEGKTKCSCTRPGKQHTKKYTAYVIWHHQVCLQKLVFGSRERNCLLTQLLLFDVQQYIFYCKVRFFFIKRLENSSCYVTT